MIEKTFTASDGLQLFERRWAPEGQPRAAVVIVHGYGHHCGSFAEVAARLTACGYAVFAFDQRGFGKSEGKRGYIASFDQTLADLDTYLAHITADVAGLPLFLMGHSYGGLVLGIYVATRQPAVQGLVFSSPLMKLSDDISPLLKKAAGVLSVLTPWLPVNKVEIDGVSRDPEYLAQAPNDPLCFYGNIVARTGAEIAKAVDRVQGVMDEIRLPLIVLHGGSDRLAETAGGRRLHEQAGAADKTLKLYEGAYHELFNDLDRERFYADLIAWLDAH